MSDSKMENDISSKTSPKDDPATSITQISENGGETTASTKSSTVDTFKDYQIGDIVWAKIGKYPFWPAVICMDPKTKKFIKENKNKKNANLHVRFCNDDGRRSWTTNVENYSGKDNLLSKYPDCLAYLKNRENLKNSWNKAVQQADDLLKFARESIMIKFFKTFSDSNPFDNSVASDLNNSSKKTNSVIKIKLKYTKKKSPTVAKKDRDFKISKTNSQSVNCGASTSSQPVDIPLPLITDNDSKIKQNPVKMGKSTKKNPLVEPGVHIPQSLTSAPLIPEKRKLETSELEEAEWIKERRTLQSNSIKDGEVKTCE